MTTTAAPDSVFFEFPARSYLEKYYGAMGPENIAFVRSITDYLSARDVPTDSVIEVAGGPCLYSLLSLMAMRARPFTHVTFTDIGWKNLREVDGWLRDDPSQFDYSPLLDWLGHATGRDPDLLARALRRSTWDLAAFDWRDDVPAAWRGAHDVVSCHFFAESATSDEEELVAFLRKLAGLGRPGATLLLSFISRSRGYRIQQREFPAFAVDDDSIFGYLDRAGLRLEDVEVRTVAAEDPGSDPGYDGLVFLGARLPEKP